MWSILSPTYTYLERQWRKQVFEQRPCSLSSPTARAAMQSDPSPFCQCKGDPTLSCWWNKALLEGLTPCLWFTSTPQLHHTFTSERHWHIHTEYKHRVHRFTLAHSLLPMSVKLLKQSFWIWSIWGCGMKSKGVSLCVQAKSCGVWSDPWPNYIQWVM